jgi:hypothetical protein
MKELTTRKNITIDIPRERKGSLPTQEYDVKMHLSFCPPSKKTDKNKTIPSQSENMEIASNIIQGDYAHLMEALGEKKKIPTDFT